ncbi:MAG: response regulator [Rhodopirellula sp.]|nr:response regulator [Rhodopirellula sp.]
MRNQLPSVLIVDDNRDFCDSLFDCIEAYGIDVNATHDPATALHLIQSTDYDVALLDFNMPGMNGLVLFSRMRQLHPKIHGILMTACVETGIEQAARQAGFRQVVSKPIDIGELLLSVRSLWARRRRMSARRRQNDCRVDDETHVM